MKSPSDWRVYGMSRPPCCRFYHASLAEPSTMPGWMSYAYSRCRKRNFATPVDLTTWNLATQSVVGYVSCELWSSNKTGGSWELDSLMGISSPTEASSLYSTITSDEQTVLTFFDPTEDFSATAPCPSHHLEPGIYSRDSALGTCH